ncbi:MAG: hypothetical protein KAW92_06155 [Candidatus Cloacimonetes bacterium]|nr:hypothetical protein [Candidatus Cloacimonadota bacterium]
MRVPKIVLLFTILFELILSQKIFANENIKNKIVIEDISKDSLASNIHKGYFYYNINVIEAGVGLAGKDNFVEIDLLRIALGCGRLPILFGINIFEIQYLPPFGFSSVSATPLCIYYILNFKERKRQIFLYTEVGLSGNYFKGKEENDELDDYIEEEDKRYKYRYLDLGIAYSFKAYSELWGIPMNSFEIRIGLRLANTKGDVETPMSGFYLSAKFKLGWFGRKVLH